MLFQSYNEDIANAIHRHLVDRNFKFRFLEENGVFHFNIGISGRAKTLIYHIAVNLNGFTVAVRYPFGPDLDNTTEVNYLVRFMTRVNYTLRNGCFEMDFEDGEVRYRIYCSCHDIEPSDAMIEEAIMIPVAMCEKYGEGLLGILFRGWDDKEAFDKCTNTKSALQTKLEKLRDLAKKREHDEMDTEGSTEAPAEVKAQIAEGFLRMLLERRGKQSEGKDAEEYYPLLEDDE